MWSISAWLAWQKAMHLCYGIEQITEILVVDTAVQFNPKRKCLNWVAISVLRNWQSTSIFRNELCVYSCYPFSDCARFLPAFLSFSYSVIHGIWINHLLLLGFLPSLYHAAKSMKLKHPHKVLISRSPNLGPAPWVESGSVIKQHDLDDLECSACKFQPLFHYPRPF